MKSFVRISTLMWADILVGYALFELPNYLTDVWNLSLAHAAGILNIWGGISYVLPVFLLFFVDAFLGHFKMLVISSATYSVGILLVTLSTPPALANSTGTCKQYEPQCIGHTQKVLFYIGKALIAVGIAGNLVSVKTFLEEQDTPDDGRKLGTLLKLPGFFMVVVVPVVGAIALPYIKPWFLRFLIPTVCTIVATSLFLSGSCRYDSNPPQGSPITNVCRVFVASCFKQSKPFPDDANQLYRKDGQEHLSFTHTRLLRCLEKAAIKQPDRSIDEQVRKWRLCSIEEVEEAKIAVRMVPMWMTLIFCGIVLSIGNTYFVEQANHLNRYIGTWKVPLQVLLLFFKCAKSFFDYPAECLLKIKEKCVPAIGIAVAMMFSVLCCITAAGMETKRLNVIRKHDLLDKPDEDIPMSIFWLFFQFFLLAGLDLFYEKSVAAFYKDQAPDSMKSYLEYFTRGVSGLGFMCSVLSVFVVGRISERGGKPNWFQHTLNRSRLDRYYWVLAALSSVNLAVFVMVASCYRYKDREEGGSGEVGGAGESGLSSNGNDHEGLTCCCC